MRVFFHRIPPFVQASVPGPGEVHIFIVDIAQAKVPASDFLACMSPEEKKKADAYRFYADRERFVVARGILRTLLGDVLSVNAGSITFETAPTGKPKLSIQHGITPPLSFNVSHSGNIALIALAADRDIGLDVEHMRDIPDADRLVEAFFSKTEREQYNAIPPEKRSHFFYTLWTCKEAIVKATGEGLACGLDSFSVSITRNGEPTILKPPGGRQGDGRSWRLGTFAPSPGYVAAYVGLSRPTATQRDGLESATALAHRISPL